MSLPDVHFNRPFYGSQSSKGTSHGTDVLYYKWVLIRAGLMPAPATGMPDDVFNANAVKGTKTLQKRAGIEPISGNVGKATFEASRSLRKKGSKTEYAWDAFRIEGYNKAVGMMQYPTDVEIRNFIAGQLYVTYVNRDSISYSQVALFGR